MPVRVSMAKMALLVTIVGILIAGLWPYDFKPRNNVLASPGEGLRINRYGQIFSAEPWQTNGQGQFSVEFWFQPAGTGYAYDSPVLSLSQAGIVNFAIGQSGRDLYVAVLILNADKATVLGKFWLDGACGTGRPIFVTVVSSEESVRVYLDRHLSRSFSVPVSRRALSGTILLGHTPSGDQPWSGTLVGAALYDRRLSGEQVMHHVDQWLAGQTSELGKQEGTLSLYDLRSVSANQVRNLGRYGPDLVIPASFNAHNKPVLEWPKTWSRSIVLDALENIAGFIPVGFVFVIASGGVSRKSAARILITAISAAALLSLLIELLQVYLPSRDSSLSDLLTNVLGAALGALLGVALIFGRKHTSTQKLA